MESFPKNVKKKRKPEHNGDTGDDGQEHEPEPENNINLAIFLLWRFRMKIQPPSRLWCSFQAHRARQTFEGFQSHHIIQSDILSSCNFACLNLWQDDQKKTLGRFWWVGQSGTPRLGCSSWQLQCQSWRRLLPGKRPWSWSEGEDNWYLKIIEG